jgi:hypothetical protein
MIPRSSNDFGTVRSDNQAGSLVRFIQSRLRINYIFIHRQQLINFPSFLARKCNLLYAVWRAGYLQKPVNTYTQKMYASFVGRKHIHLMYRQVLQMIDTVIENERFKRQTEGSAAHANS